MPAEEFPRMAGHSDPFHHVRDWAYFEVPQFLAPEGKIHLPAIGPFQLTKFMVLQLVAVVIVLWIGSGLAKRVRGGVPVNGRWWNFWETLALYIRDNVVRPTIGTGHHGHGDHGHGHVDPGHHGHEHSHAGVTSGHPADKYLPFVWSCFFYVLICNLLGAIPWLGSPTGEINVTGVLAVCAFGATVFYGSQELTFGGFWKALCPGMDMPSGLLGTLMRVFLIPMIWVIELVGLFIKHGVLAVRLFANIMAGHTVVAMFLGFIALFGLGDVLFYLVTPASIAAQVGVGLLELFVAFLQAYIFAFLATLFIGTAVHPH
jgi:F-type H+-transporting ATPase subunit a